MTDPSPELIAKMQAELNWANRGIDTATRAARVAQDALDAQAARYAAQIEAEWLVAHDVGFGAGFAANRKELDRLQADYDAALHANDIRWERAMDVERSAWRAALDGYEALATGKSDD